MRALAVMVAVVVAMPSWAEPVEVAAPERGRGWLTGLAIGLVGVGIGALAVGSASAANAAQLDALIAAYGTPSKAEAPTVKSLLDSRESANAVATPLLVTGGVLIAGALVSLIIDTVFSHAPAVAFVGVRSGGVLTLSATF